MALGIIRAGKAVFTAVTDPFYLYAKGTTAGNYDSFKVNGTAYQVTAGKTLYISKYMYASTALSQIFIGYADTSIADAAGPPTNPVQKTADFFCAVINVNYEIEGFWISIPASKFPMIRVVAVGGAINVGIMAYEV